MNANQISEKIAREYITVKAYEALPVDSRPVVQFVSKRSGDLIVKSVEQDNSYMQGTYNLFLENGGRVGVIDKTYLKIVKK